MAHARSTIEYDSRGRIVSRTARRPRPPKEDAPKGLVTAVAGLAGLIIVLAALGLAAAWH